MDIQRSSILLGLRANGRLPGSDVFDFSATDHRCRPQSLAHRPNSDASVAMVGRLNNWLRYAEIRTVIHNAFPNRSMSPD